MPKVDIITTTYRNKEKLKICLKSIIENTKHADFKWYVMANDPDDEVKQIIHDGMYIDDILFTDRIEPVFNDTNDGSFSSNNNQLAELGDGEYILLLNDDIEPINDMWLYNMQKILDSDEKVGAVGALLSYPDRKTLQHCGVFFSAKTNNLPYHMHYRQPLNKVAKYISIPRYYQAVTGACMLVRREDYEKLGGLNEEFWYMYEDIEMCLRIKKELKKRIVYCPSAQLIHHEGISKDGKDNPKFKENINTFRRLAAGKYFDDLDFYLNNTNHMAYKIK